MYTNKHIFPPTVTYVIHSILLLGFPILFDILYNHISEYSRLTFTFFGKLAFLYSSVILIGVLLALHMFSFLSHPVKQRFPVLLGVLLAAETALLYFGRVYGSLLSCFFFVTVLAEIFIKKRISRNKE